MNKQGINKLKVSLLLFLIGFTCENMLMEVKV